MGGGSTITNSATRIEALDLQSSAYGVTVPIVYGQAKLVGNLLWYGGFKSHEHRKTQRTGKGGGGGSKTVTITYTYSASMALGLCEGEVSKVLTIWKGDSLYKTNPLEALNLGLMSGAIGQNEWSTITNVAPTERAPYSGLAYIVGTDYDLGDSAQIVNHQFEVQSRLAYSVSSSTPDANPADITKDLLTNARYGARVDSNRIDFTEWANYCAASGLLMSAVFSEQESAASIVEKMGELTNSAPVWIVDTLKVIPYCEETVVGTYGSYTPDVRPVYDLNDDHFLPLSGDGEPIELENVAQADAKNHVQVEFKNRHNSYSVEVTDAQDQADIDLTGKRSASVLEAHWICEPTIARKVAQLLLQRSLYIRAKYKFALPWTFALLEPMDVVTLTDEALGLDRTPVRITSIEEGSDGTLKIEAEELLYGAAEAPSYDSETGIGFSHDYAVDPGNVETPAFIELPASESKTGLELAVAVRGKNPYWGGCTLHYSLDGESYKTADSLWFGSDYGQLLTTVGSSAQIKVVGGEVDDATPTESELLESVLWIGGSDPEYLGFGSVELKGELTYQLGQFNRAAYKTKRDNHVIGDPVAVIDYSRLIRTGALPLDFIGKTLYFKFTSFNVYGAAEQSLHDVPAYEYTIRGYMAKLPPVDPVTGFKASIESYGIALSWDPHTDGDVSQYELRVGDSWADGQRLGLVSATFSRQNMKTDGSYRFWIAPVDAFGNVGPVASVEITIDKPIIKSAKGTIVKGLLNLSWEIQAASYAITNYDISWEQDGHEEHLGESLTTTFAIDVVYKGVRTFLIRAIDAAGNKSEPARVTIEIIPPSRVLGFYSQVVDNNVMLYWRDPEFGSLPIAEYVIKQGASWTNSQRVGSNGNSNFMAIFEKQGGDKKYWIAAIDTAGNQGEITSLPVKIYEPPDYELQSSKDLDLIAGENMARVSGKLFLPVNTSESWQEHFQSHGWDSPLSQVNADYPIYMQPTTLDPATQSWIIDYETELPSMSVDVQIDSDVVAGEVDTFVQISYRSLEQEDWILVSEGAFGAYIAGFRYLKIDLTVTALTDRAVMEIRKINVALSVKKKSDSGQGASYASDVDGTWVDFNEIFIDAETPMVQPIWTPPNLKIAIVDFEDIPNPKGFKVLIFDKDGHRVDGRFSWTTRGY